MREKRAVSFGLGVIFLLTSGFTFSSAQQSPAFPEWIPPQPRTKDQTPFAPKVRKGNNMFTSESEVWLADAMLDDRELPRFEHPLIETYLSQIGKNLVKYSPDPTRKIEIILLDIESPTAFSPGAGRVFITRGLLKTLESEDELAGILAHEMGHDAMKHLPKTITRQLFWMTDVGKRVNSPEEVKKAVDTLFSQYRGSPIAGFFEDLSGIARMDELEADRCAFYTTYRAGYNPYAVVTALKRLEKRMKATMGKGKYTWSTFVQFWLGTHPPTGQRRMALDWERFMVKAPAKEAKFISPAFEVMRTILKDQPTSIESR